MATIERAYVLLPTTQNPAERMALIQMLHPVVSKIEAIAKAEEPYFRLLGQTADVEERTRIWAALRDHQQVVLRTYGGLMHSNLD